MSTPPFDSKSDGHDLIIATVRDRYGRIAESGTCCCGSPSPATSTARAPRLGYDAADLALLPEGADLGLGCGAPLQYLELEPGEQVLDLGSGAGIDALIAARRVGPGGRVIGVDMTPEMLSKARANAAAAGLDNVEFREGRLEALPVDDNSVDAVTSNCVINLVPDKDAVFREVVRVLRPGGRLVVSDIMLDGELPEPVAASLMAWVGCVAGATRREVYLARLAAAGFHDVEVLRDADYLAAAGDQLPPDLQGIVEETGVRPESLAGIVRSVTYRARKR